MKFKSKIYVAAIAILFVLFVGYGIEVFHESPLSNYERPHYTTQVECENANGTWEDSPKPVRPTQEDQETGYCNIEQYYDTIEAAHNKILFIITTIIGVLTVIIASVLRKEDIISTGLLSGAILVLLYGSIRYWQYAHNALKFILLGIALGIVVWSAAKSLKKK
jgi:hypothetical protein